MPARAGSEFHSGTSRRRVMFEVRAEGESTAYFTIGRHKQHHIWCCLWRPPWCHFLRRYRCLRERRTGFGFLVVVSWRIVSWALVSLSRIMWLFNPRSLGISSFCGDLVLPTGPAVCYASQRRLLGHYSPVPWFSHIVRRYFLMWRAGIFFCDVTVYSSVAWRSSWTPF